MVDPKLSAIVEACLTPNGKGCVITQTIYVLEENDENILAKYSCNGTNDFPKNSSELSIVPLPDQ